MDQVDIAQYGHGIKHAVRHIPSDPLWSRDAQHLDKHKQGRYNQRGGAVLRQRGNQHCHPAAQQAIEQQQPPQDQDRLSQGNGKAAFQASQLDCRLKS